MYSNIETKRVIIPSASMNLLLLKLILSPIIIGGASLAGRKWGHAISGWLVGLPLTSGSVMLFLALSHPISFVITSASGTLSGGFPLVAFCLTYAWISKRFQWPISSVASLIVYFLFVIVMRNIELSILPLYAMFILGVLLGMR